MFKLQQEIQLINQFLKRFANNLTGNTTDADDLYQDTLVKIYLNRNRFETDSNFKAWAATIMRNIFINDYRKRARRRAIISHHSNTIFSNTNIKIFNMGEHNLAEEDLLEIIDKLHTNYKTPFWMVYQGYKYEEIAEMMDLPIGTIKSRVFFARKKLIRMYSTKHLSRA